MLDAAYGRLKAVSPRNLVIGGNTFTVGTVAPLYFIRALRLPSGRPPRMDLWGHNPFSLRTPDLDHPPLGSGFADFSDLDTLVRVLDRNMRRAKLRKQRHLKIFMSEYTLPTDHANFEFNFFVSRKTQAQWITRALHIVRSWKRLATFGYLGLYDDDVRPDGEQVERGLLERDGHAQAGLRGLPRRLARAAAGEQAGAGARGEHEQRAAADRERGVEAAGRCAGLDRGAQDAVDLGLSRRVRLVGTRRLLAPWRRRCAVGRVPLSSSPTPTPNSAEDWSPDWTFCAPDREGSA